jgi:hypothetical protein
VARGKEQGVICNFAGLTLTGAMGGRKGKVKFRSERRKAAGEKPKTKAVTVGRDTSRLRGRREIRI